jgi:hypothetical protein
MKFKQNYGSDDGIWFVDKEKTELCQGKYKEKYGEYWYKDGMFHREDGHAIIESGGREWYLNGLLHREDGPAVENTNGTKEWWLNDVEIFSNETNNLHKYDNLSEAFKKSIIKYEFSK